MSIIGFNITKISAEKKSPVKGKVKVENNISISDITEANINSNDKKSAVAFKFLYKSMFEPSIGNIDIEGILLYMVKKEEAIAIVENWKKDNKMPKEILTGVFNHIIQKCSIESVILAKELKLPTPIPLQKVKATTTNN